MKTPSTLLAALILAFLGTTARADMPPDVTPEESGLLPAWCNYTMTWSRLRRDDTQYRQFLARYGEGWSHMHHYCFALIDIMRLSRPKGIAERRASYVDANRALQNIDYVLGQTDPKFAFRPEMLTQRTRLLTRTGNHKKAAETAQALVAEWPDLPEGYVLIAQMQKKAGNRAAATEILRKGDEQVADKDRYARMRKAYQLD